MLVDTQLCNHYKGKDRLRIQLREETNKIKGASQLITFKIQVKAIDTVKEFIH